MQQFTVGEVAVAPGTANTLASSGLRLEDYLDRHASGDWGHFGSFDLGPLADDLARCCAVLFLMFDGLFGGRDTVLLEIGDIDLVAGTVFGRHRRETRKLSKKGQAALKTWLVKSASHAGTVFSGLDAAAVRDVFRAIQGSKRFANSVAVLMGRGPIESAYSVELLRSSGGWLRKFLGPGSARQQSSAVLVIRTSLNEPRQTLAELSENPGILTQLSVIAAPNHMFGPDRKPFERTRFVFQP
jgi:hypothetical protein